MDLYVVITYIRGAHSLDLKSATIVAHSGTLKMLRIILENRPFSHFSLDMDNGRGYWVEIERDDFHRFKLLISVIFNNVSIHMIKRDKKT